MKKFFFTDISLMLVIVLFFFSCQKEVKQLNPKTDLQSASTNSKEKTGCHLVYANFGNSFYKYHYNNSGLADEWEISDYGTFRQEYDAGGRLITSRQYDGTDLVFTIYFFYHDKKVVKEIWYNGNTTDVYDEVFYTYNEKEQIVRSESFINDYYTIFKYTPPGNIAEWHFYLGGNPFYSSYITYGKPFKNPLLAVPGIEYSFPSLNGAYSKWWGDGGKLVAYDENGNPEVLYEYDPQQAVWQGGPQHYPLALNNFDLISATWVLQTFEYENCGSSVDNSNSNSRIAQPGTAIGKTKINQLLLLHRNPLKSIKEQVKEWRKDFKTITQ